MLKLDAILLNCWVTFVSFLSRWAECIDKMMYYHSYVIRHVTEKLKILVGRIRVNVLKMSILTMII